MLRVESFTTGKVLELNDNDRQAIRQTWQKIGDHTLWAQRLFAKILVACPAFSKATSFHSLSGKHLLNDAKFRSFCQRFADFWQNLVQLLCVSDDPADWQQAVDSIRGLGQRHSLNRKVTFEAPIWLMIKNEIVLSITGYSDICRSKDCLSWNKLLMFTVAEMKSAFNEGVRRRSHMRPQSQVYAEPGSDDSIGCPFSFYISNANSSSSSSSSSTPVVPDPQQCNEQTTSL
ncbi:hypothetical protein T08_12338 [Trichinella sp. T8]|nr:hypothetical protein T08_12338 [Trichinella sp. T8]